MHGRTGRGGNDSRPSNMRGSSMMGHQPHQPPIPQNMYQSHQNQQHKNASIPYNQRSQSNQPMKSHHQTKRTQQQFNHQPAKIRNLQTFDGHVIEEINELLGFPDLYIPEQNAKFHDTDYVPEIYFSKEFAQEGYREAQYKRKSNPPIHPYGTFVTTQKNNEFPVFIQNLKSHEAGLRGDWKTFSTRKIREERRLLYESATKACQCDNPKIGFPDMSSNDESIEQWMDDLAGNGLRKMFHSLRDLASHIPHGLKVKNVINMLAQYQVPFIRAIWFIKVLCLNQFRGRQSDLSQLWTEMIIGFLNDQLDPLNTSFSEHDIKYSIRLINWCIEEKLLDTTLIENWFISKCEEVISPSGTERISPIVNKRASKTSVDSLFEQHAEMKTRYQKALTKCAELISQRNCSNQTKITLLHFVKMLKQQTDATKYFQNIYHLIDREGGTYSIITHDMKLHVIESLDKFIRHGNLEKLYSALKLNRKELSVIPIICEWAYTSRRFGHFRRYVISSLLLKFLNDFPDLGSTLQQILFEILNNFQSTDTQITHNLFILFADFIRVNVFSFEQYLDSLVSRGITNSFCNVESITTNNNYKLHKECVLNFPLERSASNYLKTQRKIALFGPSFSRNRDLLSAESQVQKYFDSLVRHIEGLHSTQESLNEILDSLSTCSLGVIFAVTDQIYQFTKSLVISGRSPHVLSESILVTIVRIFVQLHDYRQLQDILICIVDHNHIHGEDSVWLSFEHLICKIVLNYLPYFVSTDRTQFVSKLVLSQCKKDQKQSLLDTRKRKVIEDYLKQIQSMYPEVFKFDGFKRDFPHLSIFLDGIPTTPTPSYNSQTDGDDVVPISPTLQLIPNSLAGLFMDHFRQAMKQQLNSLDSITSMLTMFLEKNQGSISTVVFSSRKEIYPLLTYCLEHFEVDNPFVVSILREMLFTGCYMNNNELYDVLCHITGERFLNIFNNSSAAIQMVQFLIVCVTHDVLSYEILANGIMRSLFGQVLKKLLPLITNDQSDIPTPLLGAALITLWFARTVLSNDPIISSSKCPRLYELMTNVQLSSEKFMLNISEDDQALFKFAKMHCSVQQIPNFIKIIGDFCYRNVQRQNGERCPSAFVDLADIAMELLESFLSQDDVIIKLSNRLGVLHKSSCEVIYERFPSAILRDDSNLSYRQAALTTIVYHTRKLLNPAKYEKMRKKLEKFFIMPQSNSPFNLPTISDMIKFIRSIDGNKTWDFWHDAFLLDTFLFHMKKKVKMDQSDVEKLNKSLIEPILQMNEKDQEFKVVYAYTVLHQVKHSAKLKEFLKEQFVSLLTKMSPSPQQTPHQFTKEENEQWIQAVSHMGIILSEMSRTDLSLGEQVIYKICSSVQHLLRAADNTRIFEQKLELAGLCGIQQRLITYLKLINSFILICQLFNSSAKPKPSSTMRSAVVKQVLESCFALIDHKLSQISYSLSGSDVETTTCSQIAELLRSVMNELLERIGDLQTDEQYRPRGMISDFCAQKLTPQMFTSKMSNIINSPFKKSHTGETWVLIEDYISTCNSCRSNHGHITPNTFNSTRVVQRGNHLYNNTTPAITQGLTYLRSETNTTNNNNKRKRDTPGSDGIPYYSSPSPVRSPRNGTPTNRNEGEHREAKRFKPNNIMNRGVADTFK